MCGIIGYVGHRPWVTEERLLIARDRMTARGPDDAGLWVKRWSDAPSEALDPRPIWVGLAHRRLAIRDLSPAGHQPFFSPCGRYALVYNGELYETDRLRARLSGWGVRLQTRCDTEILLHLLIHEGLSALEHINGVFGFAFWDAETRALLLARDRFGVKPLYYARPNGSNPLNLELDSGAEGLLFSSEIKGLLATEAVSDALDWRAQMDLITLTYTPGAQTVIAAIAQVPSGSWMRWTPEGVERGTYWTPNLAPLPTPPSFKQATRHLRDLLCASVEERLVSDVPVGLFLSGGVDSTALLYAASEVSAAPLNTFTVKFSEREFDESDYARRAAKAFGAHHHEELITPHPDEFMGPLMDALDGPFADSSAIPLWYLTRTARQRVTVALGGDGGDEIFAGYRTHQAAQLARVYRALPSSLTDVLLSLTRRLPVRYGKVSLDLKLKQFTRAASAPPPIAHCGFKTFLNPELSARLFEPTLARLRDEGAEELAAFRHFLPHFDEIISSASPLERANVTDIPVPLLHQHLNCDQRLYLPDNILIKGDRVTMGHGVELRVPLLDVRLTEWANALPPSYKLRGMTTKAVLKGALKGRVPSEVIKRPKAGFNVPMAQWLLGPLKPLCDDLLSADRVRRVGLWSAEVVEEMRAQHALRSVDHSRPLWAMLCFMMFNERHRGGRGA